MPEACPVCVSPPAEALVRQLLAWVAERPVRLTERGRTFLGDDAWA